MKTIKEFCAQSNIPAKLIRSTVRQAGGWQAFKEIAEDVVNHGADGGFGGFFYYTDTCAFFKRNKMYILGYAKEQANEFGQGLYEMIGGFNCLKISDWEVAEAIHAPTSPEKTTVQNALAWYALEEVCRDYQRIVEGD